MKREWNVRLIYYVELGEDDWDTVLDLLLERFEGADPVVSKGVNKISVAGWFDGDMISDAISDAISRIKKSRVAEFTSAWKLVGVESYDPDEIDDWVNSKPFPELIGVAEVAARLVVSKQRVSELSRLEDFPTPVARLASGPVWVSDNLNTFIKSWKRSPGRPKAHDL